jgi:hypothetical protein
MYGILLLKPNTKLVWKMERNICPLPINHVLQSFFTTSLLLPSFSFQDSTLKFEFVEKQKFP